MGKGDVKIIQEFPSHSRTFHVTPAGDTVRQLTELQLNKLIDEALDDEEAAVKMYVRMLRLLKSGPEFETVKMIMEDESRHHERLMEMMRRRR